MEETKTTERQYSKVIDGKKYIMHEMTVKILEKKKLKKKKK